MSMVDAVTLEILGNRLLSIAEEIGTTLIRTAYSTNIKERRDCSAAIFDAQGEMIAQAEHIPMHLGSLLGIVKALLARTSPGDMKPGDTFMTNDPYSGGGTHLPDITMVSPVFTQGQLIGFVTNIAHHSDVGGKVPGSTSGDATSIFQEGVRIPLCRVSDSSGIIQESMDFVCLNSRTPSEREGDLAAQVAANRIGAQRMAELVEHYGVDRFKAVSNALLDYAEALLRAGIRSLPDTTHTFTDFLDDDGINLGVPVPIRVTVSINGDEAVVDFTGSSAQVAGPINLPLNGTLATVFYAFKALVGPDIPSNTGIYRALKVIAPERSIVNCAAPAPVGERIDTAQRVADAIFGAMANVAPNRVLAASNSSVTTATFSGDRVDNQGFFVYLETIAGGSGAHRHGDGLSGVQVHMTNTSNLPVEALEREYPLRVTQYRLRADSGGPGRYRGGLGIEREIMALQNGLTFSGLADRQVIAPWGLDNGEAGATGEFHHLTPTGESFQLASKVSGRLLAEGDRIRVATPGAGGVGDPFARPVNEVSEDVREGWVSVEAAHARYGVVCNARGEIDVAATASLRALPSSR